MDGEAIVAAHGAERHGIVLVSAVLALGAPWHVLEYMRARGRLVSIGRGVDRLRDHPWTFEARCRAALDLAGPGAVLGGVTAARLHGFYRYRNVDVIEVLVRRGTDHRTAVGRVLQTGWLPTGHITTLDGMPITTPARTFFDLCARPPGRMRVNHPAHDRAMRAVYDDCLARRGVTFALEAAVLVVMAKRGRPGTRLVRRILTTCPTEYVPTFSDTERLFVELVDAYGLAEPSRQVTISGVDGFVGVVDFCWPRARLVVEVDSSHHDSDLEKLADAERDRRLAAAGYVVRRVRFWEIVEHPATLARELGAAIQTIPG